MSRIFFSVLFTVFLSASLAAQNQTVIDSLIQSLEFKPSDLQKVKTYVEISSKYRETDSLNTVKYANKAIELANKINYLEGRLDAYFNIAWVDIERGHYVNATEKIQNIIQESNEHNYLKGKANGYFGLGNINRRQDNYDSALVFHKKSLLITKAIGFKEGEGDNYYGIGVTYYRQGKHKEALEFYLQSLQVRKEIGHQEGIASCYNNIAIIYFIKGQYDKALEYFFNSLTITKKLSDTLGLANSYNNIGVVFSKQQRYKEALDYYLKAHETNIEIGNRYNQATSSKNIGDQYSKLFQYDEALEYYQESLAIREKLEDKDGIAGVLYSIGVNYDNMGNHEKSLEYLYKSLSIKEELGNEYSLNNTLISIGFVYLEQKKWALSKEIFQEALTRAQQNDYIDQIQNISNGLAEAEAELGNYKSAYEAHVLFKQISDSLFNEETTRNIARLETTFKFEQEIDSIQIANNTEQLILNKDINLRKARQNYTIIVLALVIIILIVTFLLLRSKIQTNIRLKLQRNKLQVANKTIKAFNSGLEKLMHGSLDEVYIFDAETLQFIYCNSKALINIDYSEDEIKVITPIDIIPKLTLLQFENLLKKTKTRDSYSFETILKRKNGSTYNALFNLRFTSYNGRDVYACNVLDITELNEAKVNLVQAEIYSELAIEGAELGLWEYEPKTKKTFYNRMYYKILGYSDTAIESTKLFYDDIIHPEDAHIIDKHLKEINELKKDSFEATVRIKHKNGEYRWILDKGKVIERDSNGKPSKLAGTHLDITNLINAISEKNVLLQEVHHRVKNNLAVLSALLELDIMEYGEQNRLRNALNRVHAIKFVHELLYQSKSLSNINLKDYINSLLGHLRISSQKVDIQYRIDVNEINVNCAIPLGLLINELVSNSAKFSNENGTTITISVESTVIGDQKYKLKYTDTSSYHNKLDSNKDSFEQILIQTLLGNLAAEYTISTNSGFNLEANFKPKKAGSHGHAIPVTA